MPFQKAKYDKWSYSVIIRICLVVYLLSFTITDLELGARDTSGSVDPSYTEINIHTKSANLHFMDVHLLHVFGSYTHMG